eukprot:c31847_g1_i1 orf=1-327(+)
MYCKYGSIVEAESVFTFLSHRHVDAYNAMLSLYVSQGEGERALHLYREMQKELVFSNYVTLACILQACSETACLEMCYQIHFDILSAEYDWVPSIAAALTHAYGSCAS